MTFELNTISQKKYSQIFLFSISFNLFLSFGLAILFSNGYFVMLIIPFTVLGSYLAQKLSELVTVIDMRKSEYMLINDHKIPYKSIVGYFVNNSGLMQKRLSLRLDSEEIVHIIMSSFGEVGEKFTEIQNEIILTLSIKNSAIQELEMADIYVKQTNKLKPLIYGSIGAVFIIDIIVIILMSMGKVNIPWQSFYMNFLVLTLIPYLKKGKLDKNK